MKENSKLTVIHLQYILSALIFPPFTSSLWANARFHAMCSVRKEIRSNLKRVGFQFCLRSSATPLYKHVRCIECRGETRYASWFTCIKRFCFFANCKIKNDTTPISVIVNDLVFPLPKANTIIAEIF